MSRIPFPTIRAIVSRFGDWKQVSGTGDIGWSPAAPGEAELPAPEEKAAESWAFVLPTDFDSYQTTEKPHIVDLHVPTDEPLTTGRFVPPSEFEPTLPILVVPTFPMQWIEVDDSYPLPLLIKARPAC